jgi:hypothetical protein
MRTDRPPVALAVLLLAVTAGCNAPLADPGDGTPVTPAAVPEDELVPYPPGLSADGVDRPGRVARAHIDVIDGRSYAWRLTQVRYSPRTVRVERLALRRAGPAEYNGTVLRQLRRRSGVIASRTLVYADGRHRYTRTADDGAVSYQRTPVARYGGGEGTYEEAAGELLTRYLAVENASVVRTERGGETLFRLTGRGSKRVANGDSYRLMALVTPAGLVRELEVSYQGPEGENEAFELDWRYAGLGETTVRVPDWYGPARTATAPATTTTTSATSAETTGPTANRTEGGGDGTGDAAVSPRRARPARSSGPGPAPPRPRAP